MVIGQWKISPPLMTTSEPPPECWGQDEHKFEGFVVLELMVGWENGWVVLGTQQLHRHLMGIPPMADCTSWARIGRHVTVLVLVLDLGAPLSWLHNVPLDLRGDPNGRGALWDQLQACTRDI
jgi:hypothetical protein